MICKILNIFDKIQLFFNSIGLKLCSDQYPFCVMFLISPIEIQVEHCLRYGSKEKSSSKKSFKKEIVK